ncbi:MAG TPA: co-chaperone GroES [Aquella sp.]|nr:co-chaperone GroES [Aquella sp.]
MNNYRLLEDQVLVEPDDFKTTTDSGIIIVNQYQQAFPSKGTVIATGPGKLSKKGLLLPMDVKVGDKVHFDKYGLNEKELNGKKMLFMDQNKILLVVE